MYYRFKFNTDELFICLFYDILITNTKYFNQSLDHFNILFKTNFKTIIDKLYESLLFAHSKIYDFLTLFNNSDQTIKFPLIFFNKSLHVLHMRWKLFKSDHYNWFFFLKKHHSTTWHVVLCILVSYLNENLN